VSTVGRWGVGAILLAALNAAAAGNLSVPTPVGAAATMSPLDAGRQAAKAGDWEAAADAYADALFENPGSPEARKFLRLAAEHALEKRTGRVQYERMKILYELGLTPEPPVEEKAPEALKPPAAVKLGPPTLTVPKSARRPRRPAHVYAVEEPAPEIKVTTPADREMARFLYFQGLKAYAENELDEAKQAWSKALQLDPQMERAARALERVAKAQRKP